MRRMLLGALTLVLVPLLGRAAVIDPGTSLEATLDRTLSTRTTHVGDRFSATVQKPVVAPDGRVLVPAGSRVLGEVTNVQAPEEGRPAALKLAVKELEVEGVDHPLAAKVTRVNLATGHSGSKARRNALIGGVGGAVLGGATHGWKGALVGGALGAGAGTVVGLETSGREGKLREGAALTVKTTAPTRLGP